MERLLAISNGIDAVLTRVGMVVGWLFLVATLVIIFDVLSRKFGYRFPVWDRPGCRSSSGICTPRCSPSG